MSRGMAGTGVGSGAGVQVQSGSRGQRGCEHRPDQSTKLKGQRVRSRGHGHTAARPRHLAGLRGRGCSGQGSWGPGVTRRPHPQVQPALTAAAAGTAWPRGLSEAGGPQPKPAPRKAEVGPSARGERPAVRRGQGRWGPEGWEGRDVTVPRVRPQAQAKQIQSQRPARGPQEGTRGSNLTPKALAVPLLNLLGQPTGSVAKAFLPEGLGEGLAGGC